MTCENCDRENVVKAYCFFCDRKVDFKLITGKIFNVSTFAEYAIEVELVWKYEITCRDKETIILREYWKELKPVLIITYKLINDK